ncbi:hypothetical protein ABMA28_000070 [Loxostege sticticalis]|uniref:Reverse transcriptase domain-containing protein n=1 Tax=Loxostege sticticalis TaxID=481309 RepID=A0ABD0TQX7_LOXSC
MNCDTEDCNYNHLEEFIREQVHNSKVNKIKINNPPKNDWINKNIIDMINLRNDLWTQTKMNPLDINLKKKFEKQRDQVRTTIRKEKRKYYYALFQSNFNHPKKLWELINSLALNKVKNSGAPPKLMSDSGLITDGNAVCDLFNVFFSSVGSDLANQIPNSYHVDTSNVLMYDNKFSHETTLDQFLPCNVDEISKIIDDLDSNTSTGLDGISTKAIKCLKNIIIYRLTNCINTCLTRGVFPDTLKVAKVTPIYKSGCKTDPSNYRPVSVLPVISKIFERVLYTRLNAYLVEKNFLNDRQFGFRSQSNTLAAAVDLITNIKINIDQKSLALGIFIDLKKAFDTYSRDDRGRSKGLESVE